MVAESGHPGAPRTVTLAIDPVGTDAVPLTVTAFPVAVAEAIETDGGWLSRNGCALKKAHCNSLALGPVGSANCPLLSPTQ